MSQQSINAVLVDLLKEQAELIQRQIQRLQSAGQSKSASSSPSAPAPVSVPASSSTAAATEETPAKKGKKEKKEKDPLKPKRPLTAYLFFSADHTSKVRESSPGITQTEIMSTVAKMWSALNEDGKKKYHALAEKAKAEHDAAMKVYEGNKQGGSAPAAAPVVSASSSSSLSAPASPKPVKAKKAPAAAPASPAPAVKVAVPVADPSPVAVLSAVAPPTPAALVETEVKKEKKKKHHSSEEGGEKKSKVRHDDSVGDVVDLSLCLLFVETQERQERACLGLIVSPIDFLRRYYLNNFWFCFLLCMPPNLLSIFKLIHFALFTSFHSLPHYIHSYLILRSAAPREPTAL